VWKIMACSCEERPAPPVIAKSHVVSLIWRL
jgi:hypothetical protein